MAWFYNSTTGAITQASAPDPQFFILEADLHLGTGWHEYGTEADVEAAVKANGWPAPTTSLTQEASNGAASTAKQAASAAKSVIGSGFKLTFGNTTGLLSRILKVTFGGILIIAGLMRMTGADKDVIQIATTAAKGAVIA